MFRLPKRTSKATAGKGEASPFLRHMRRLLNSEVVVHTVNGDVRGKLSGIYQDHLLVVNDQGQHHVRLNLVSRVQAQPDN